MLTATAGQEQMYEITTVVKSHLVPEAGTAAANFTNFRRQLSHVLPGQKLKP